MWAESYIHVMYIFQGPVVNSSSSSSRTLQLVTTTNNKRHSSLALTAARCPPPAFVTRAPFRHARVFTRKPKAP